MIVKIDTKEKFNVITPNEASISANMTVEVKNMLLSYLSKEIPHIILNMKNVQNLDTSAAVAISEMQQSFYEHNCSFIICELQKTVEEKLDELEILEVLNVTPTESEAWDILQMEEVERELFNDDETAN